MRPSTTRSPCATSRRVRSTAEGRPIGFSPRIGAVQNSSGVRASRRARSAFLGSGAVPLEKGATSAHGDSVSIVAQTPGWSALLEPWWGTFTTPARPGGRSVDDTIASHPSNGFALFSRSAPNRTLISPTLIHKTIAIWFGERLTGRRFDSLAFGSHEISSLRPNVIVADEGLSAHTSDVSLP